MKFPLLIPSTHCHRFNHSKHLLRFLYTVIQDNKTPCKAFILHKFVAKF